MPINGALGNRFFLIHGGFREVREYEQGEGRRGREGEKKNRERLREIEID